MAAVAAAAFDAAKLEENEIKNYNDARVNEERLKRRQFIQRMKQVKNRAHSMSRLAGCRGFVERAPGVFVSGRTRSFLFHQRKSAPLGLLVGQAEKQPQKKHDGRKYDNSLHKSVQRFVWEMLSKKGLCGSPESFNSGRSAANVA
jgi:hypothetical protein